MYKRIKLENGVRVVCEKIPYLRSVSIGIWLEPVQGMKANQTTEYLTLLNICFLKGLTTEVPGRLPTALTALGVNLMRLQERNVPVIIQRLWIPMLILPWTFFRICFFNSRFEEKDIEVEKKVILEEIGMYEDSPEELVHDILSETVWEDNSLGLPILGTRETLLNINKDKIKAYINERYLPQNTVIAVAGILKRTE